MLHQCARALCAGVVFWFWASSAALAYNANPTEFELWITPQGADAVLVDAETLGWTPVDPNDPNGTRFVMSGGGWAGPGFTLDEWYIEIDLDPTVLNNISLTNTSPVTQTYLMTAILPIATFPQAQSAIKGSLGGSVTESNGDTATLGTTPIGNGAMYGALINGVLVRTLYDDPNSVFEGTAFDTSQLPAGLNYGIPIAEVVNQQLTGTMQLDLQFTLTAGDQASLTSVFNAEPIPEPATLGLMAMGLAAVLGMARRRAA